MRTAAASAMAIILGVGCGPSLSEPDVGSKRPAVLGDRCDIETKAAAPLIVDWNTSERSRFEIAIRSGGTMAVRVADCSIEPLWQCKLPGAYVYQPSSPRREKERLSDRASLFARVPVSAVSLEAKIAAGAALEIEKATVGRFVVERADLAENELKGQCDGATHFVSGIDVGAFTFAETKERAVSGGVDAQVVEAGGSQASQHEILANDGSLDVCADVPADGDEPDPACRAPIQIAITPLVPSLSKAEFIDVAVAGTKAAYQQCNVERKITNPVGPFLVLYLVADPSGSISARFPPPGPTPEFHDCVVGVWNTQRVDPFAGPEIVLQATAYSSAPSEEDEMKDIEAIYRNNYSARDPGIPPRAIAEQIFYDYTKNQITPSEEWRVPGAW